MGFKTLEEIDAYNLTRAFKLEVYRLIRSSPEAKADLRFKSQIREALSGAESNTVEGFRRWVAHEFAHFLSFSGASLQEGLTRLQDGIDREYFTAAQCVHARELGVRASKATAALQTTLRRLADENRRRKKRQRKRRSDETDEDVGPRTKDPTEDAAPRTKDLMSS